MSLNDLHIHRMRRELPAIENRMKALISHVRFFTSPNDLGARDLLREAGSAKISTLQIRSLIDSIVKQTGYLNASKKSDRAMLKSSLSRMDMLFEELNTEIEKFDAYAKSEINKPGRWGDAAEESYMIIKCFGVLNSSIPVIQNLIKKWRKH